MLRFCITGGTVAAAVLLAGCGATDTDVRTFVGPVLEVDDSRVCIGGAEASGECFMQTELTRGLRIGDCVRISYRTDVREPGYTASTVDQLVPGECPPG